MCQCDLLWKLSCMFFITSLYAVKFTYISRVWIYFKGPSNSMSSSGNGVPKSIYALVILMIINWITCITLCFVQLKGVCYADINKYGCIHTSKDGILIAAIFMITLDITLFCWYSRVWNNKISIIVKHAPESMKKSNDKLVRAFRIQLTLTYAALIMTFIDSCFHLIAQDYAVNTVFIIDNIMVCPSVYYVIVVQFSVYYPFRLSGYIPKYTFLYFLGGNCKCNGIYKITSCIIYVFIFLSMSIKTSGI